MTSTTALRNFLEAVAAFRHPGQPDRTDQWEARFAFGLADIAEVFEAAVMSDPALDAPRVPVTPGHGVPPPAAAMDSAAGLAQQVRSRRLAPEEIAEQYLARIASRRDLNAFITVRPEQVREDAAAIGRMVKAGIDPGPLAGVPVGVKDLMPVRGYPLTGGSAAIDPVLQATDAPVVARLRAAGALIVGTTNLHELAYGIDSANPHFGAVQNPRYPGHIPGGSSGGSAAAVAADLAVIAVGTCTGGSIRQPAACCGIVGFKPTYDAVPRDRVLPLAWSLDHIGPITRNVEDAALAFEVMAGLPNGSMMPRADRLPPKVVLPRKFFFEGLDPMVADTIEGAVARLRAAGAACAERNVPGIELAPGIQLITLNSEASAANADLLRHRAEKLGADVRLRLETGQFYLAADYVKAQRLRREVRENMIATMDEADVMLIPAMPLLPPRSGTRTVELNGRTVHVAPALTRFTSPINFCGFPAVSLPAGTAPNGLPVNMQIVGRPGADAQVLNVARWCEKVLAS